MRNTEIPAHRLLHSCNSWHKLSNGDDDDTTTPSSPPPSPSPSPSPPQRPQLPFVHVVDDNGNDNEEDEDEDNEACCMYAMCASETSSCRLLPLRGDRDRDDDGAAADDDDDERAAARKEGRRKRRVTDDKTARMAMFFRSVLGVFLQREFEGRKVGGGALR